MKICIVKQRKTYQNKNSTKLVQRLLGITADGLCGSKTTEAIKVFQRKNNLTSDGCVGFNTWKVILDVK